MEGMQAYGAGKAGGAFDPVTFVQQPQTILRIVSWVSKKKFFFFDILLLLNDFVAM